MIFLTMSNADVDFQVRDLQWRFYTTRDILLITRQIELIEKKEFVAVVLNPEHKSFLIHIAVFNINSSNEMHPSKKAQIPYLKPDEALTKLPNKYADFADVFSPKFTIELSDHTKINDHAIKLIDD